jgi:hypothetical protein
LRGSTVLLGSRTDCGYGRGVVAQFGTFDGVAVVVAAREGREMMTKRRWTLGGSRPWLTDGDLVAYDGLMDGGGDEWDGFDGASDGEALDGFPGSRSRDSLWERMIVAGALATANGEETEAAETEEDPADLFLLVPGSLPAARPPGPRR